MRKLLMLLLIAKVSMAARCNAAQHFVDKIRT